jgi:hypothetical protein
MATSPGCHPLSATAIRGSSVVAKKLFQAAYGRNEMADYLERE